MGLVSSCSSSDATLTSCAHTGLAKDDVYKYRVRALYSGGGSSWAQTTDTTVLASVPSTLSQPEVTSANGVNTISWVAPASNGSAITGYTVQYSKADASGDYAGFSEVAGCGNITSTTCTHSSLVGGDRYKYQVRATNAVGSTPWVVSDEVTVSSSTPSAPTNMTATSARGVNTVSWSLSASNGSVITGYEAEFAQKDLSTDTYGAWASIPNCSPSNPALTSCDHEGLTKGDVYSYRVRATFSGGSSSWAETTDTTVLAEVPDSVETLDSDKQ